MRVLDKRKVQPRPPDPVYHVHLELTQNEIIQLQRNMRALQIFTENLNCLMVPRPAMPNLYVLQDLAATVIEAAASQG